MIELWKLVPGASEYEVSNFGRVRRAAPTGNNNSGIGRILNPKPANNGYLFVNLYTSNGIKRCSIHRLVCEAFNGPAPTKKHEVAHGDGSRTNNFAENLRWSTRSENHKDKEGHGTHQTGLKNGNAKISDEDAWEIYKSKEKQVILADRYGVRQATISRIKLGGRASFEKMGVPYSLRKP